MSQDDVDEALALYARNWSLEDIGDHFGVSGQRVRQVLIRSERWTPRSPTGRPPKLKAAEVAAMYGSGHTAYELAAHFGVSPATIYRALTRAGTELRPR